MPNYGHDSEYLGLERHCTKLEGQLKIARAHITELEAEVTRLTDINRPQTISGPLRDDRPDLIGAAWRKATAIEGQEKRMNEHTCQFPEEETPLGTRILLPCMVCGYKAADALKQLHVEQEALVKERDHLLLELGRLIDAYTVTVLNGQEDIAYAKKALGPRTEYGDQYSVGK